MKTKMRLAVALFAAVVGLSRAVYAQDPGVALPITGEDTLRNAMLPLGVSGHIYYYSASMDTGFPGATNYTDVVGTNTEQVLAELASFRYQFLLKNTNDIVEGYTYVDDAAGNLLFFGYAEWQPSKGGKPAFGVQMSNYPLPFDDVVSAEVLALDADGHTANRYQINVQNGEALFQPWLAGAPNGLLVLKRSNGDILVFSTGTGKAKGPETESGVATMSIPEHYQLTDPDTLNIRAIFHRPTARLVFTKDASVFIDVQGLVQLPNGTAVFVRPIAISVAGESGLDYSSGPLGTTAPIHWSFGPGVYRVKFDWTGTGFMEPGLLYTGPMGVVGKGI